MTTPAPAAHVPQATHLVREFQVDSLPVRVYADRPSLGKDAARMAHECLTAALARQGQAAVILATGNSQIQFLDELVRLGGIDWSTVTLFHMDEYLGLDGGHSASFRRYMRERVESRVRPRVFHYLEGDAMEPIRECDRYSALLAAQPIDLCCMGVGENGHIAFNDPPVADLADPLRVKIVKLDRACRMQQVGEGHFPSLEAVPQYALTLTITALCSARRIICISPEKRKAQAVKAMLQGPIGPSCPASALRRQPQATLLLDTDSVALLG
ncbi:MAG TPA: glucosamine-6-phosphate deaminase [Verrucomicrobiales bacterium]|nr:glucosamine-6-phosphate deaminase [Verrucomicrobiales bacterium]